MKYTPIVGADGSGKVGGVVASRNRWGSYFRAKVTPVNPNSTRQQAVRALFAQCVNYWTSTLTASERLAWENYGANTPKTDGLGNVMYLTGQNQFIRSNVARMQANLGMVTTAPTVFNFGEPVDGFSTSIEGYLAKIGIASTAMSTTLAIAAGASADGDILLSLGNPINASRAFFKGPYQFAAAAEVSADDVEVSWSTVIALLGSAIAPVAGQYRSLRARVAYDDGRLSPVFEALAPVIEDAP